MTTHIIPSGRVPVDPYRPNVPDFDLLPSEEQKRLRDLEKVKYLAATYLGYIDSSPSPTYFPPKWKVEELKSEAERSAAPECDFFNYDALYYPTVTWAPVVFVENQNVWTVVDLAFDSTKNEMLTSQIFVNQQELADIEKSIIPECSCRTCRGACDCDKCINPLEDTEMPDMTLPAPPAQTSEIVFDVEALMSKNYDVITREEMNQRWSCGHKRDDSSHCVVCAVFGRRVED